MAMEDAGAGFLASQECRADLNGLRTEGQGGNYAARICDPTGRDHRHIDYVGNLRDK
jgi:hypothetical protein